MSLSTRVLTDHGLRPTTARLLGSVGGAALALSSFLTPAAPVQGDNSQDPAARLQVVLKSIKVHNDLDGFGNGEFGFRLNLSRVTPSCVDLVAEKGTCEVISGSGEIEFSADTGDTVDLNYRFPDINGGLSGKDNSIGTEKGFPVWRGETYWLRLAGKEKDGITADEDAGMLLWELNEANNWGIGATTERTLKSATYSGLAATTFTYEIRRMPLPDLQVQRLEIAPSQGGDGQHELCAEVSNSGATPSPGYDVVFRAAGALLTNGLVNQPAGLQPSATAKVCTRALLPSAFGAHVISASVDEARSIPEMDERNNRAEKDYLVTTPPASTEADLVVESVQVKPQKSTGPADCDPGKNDVTVTVKNAGKKAAGPFGLRLVIQEGPEKEAMLAELKANGLDSQKTVQNLDAGKSTTVTFQGVKFRKGTYTLRIQVDAQNAVAEGEESNNSKSGTVTCDTGDKKA